ncbi:L-proline glycine betaine ABC transport system permease protein ProV [Pediococcus damnosus]|uniref:ABC-type quaternary amine transporter n=1 Tax=Pediococcus damnosus TaxID=51663 RepID=A0A0R2H543_9LACO|nr:ABC transporter ATP-binding protein [Pediococcus damnosus]AMV60455.1 L-proline glycine betaine ABC transport system permease protein ProV [Pediococcus damnosus]AMV63146.1 L-proline glycine betaine ABC transport system permease protein ProV [Pediococcus damnosus]AMV64706.1 L-proline glycine betaine ABC transport system permease protein ProV [Pediococcus damnosus]AMV66963.1 L-proline glycine betaine ABC transport system permease protein ProV [Pediococcus damnosus]AMV69435.1 L-proline glycine 
MIKPKVPVIEFKNVRKEFGENVAIHDLNLAIQPGELFVLVGTSGSGKTTTLKMINQLITQTSGDILFEGKKLKDIDTQSLRLDIGYVLQQIALFPTMTVAQNVSVIPDMKKMPKKETAKIVDDLLTQVGLDPDEYRDRMPDELSGGEQQRIGIIRAIAAKPPVVLFDEPFSALDPIVRTQLQDLVLDLHQKMHNTIVFVTHDMDEALKLGDRIGVMSHGKLLQTDTPENIVQHPANQFVENFFASSVAKNMYETPLAKLIKTGYVLKTIDNSEKAKELEDTATLESAFMTLAETDVIAVMHEHKKVGYLNRQQVMRYLSEVQR